MKGHIGFWGAAVHPGSKHVTGHEWGRGKSIEFFLIQSQFSCLLAV